MPQIIKKNKFIILISIITFLIIGGFYFFIYQSVATNDNNVNAAGENWYSTSWLYRQPLSINNTTGSVLTNFQVKVTVPYSAKMNSDFSDLRFTQENGSTEMSYWIESYTTSVSAIVWVKYNVISTGSTTMYMYYGNSSAASASNGQNTFTFFDDFSGSAVDTNKWTLSGAPAVSGSIVTISNGQSMYQKNTIATPVIYEAKYQRPSVYRNRMYSSPWPSGVADWGDFAENGLYWNGWTGQAISSNTWYRVQWIYTPTTIYWNWQNYGGAQFFTRNGSYTNAATYLYFQCTESANSVEKFDWVLARGYVSAEPTSSFGSEQLQPINGVCGSANGTPTPVAPTTNLCNSGTVSTVLGTGPWSWTCSGANGGTSSNCSASVSVYNSTTYTSTNLNCKLTNQACSGVTVFKISDYRGGHAELPTQLNYSFNVCCSGTGISNLSSGAIIAKLSTNVSGGTNGTNAHLETSGRSDAAYTNNAYISSSGGVTCGYSTVGASCSDLGANYVCLSAINGTSVTGPNGITNAHASACDQVSGFSGGTTAYLCCKASNPISACTSVVASDKSLSLGTVDIQLCSGTDTSASYASDPCYSTCWKGTGQPDPSNATNWKCSVCHDNSNNPVSCTALSGTTYSWTIPGSFTFKSGSATTANPIVNFTSSSVSRQLTLQVTSGNGPVCSVSSTIKLLPTWKPINPF